VRKAMEKLPKSQIRREVSTSSHLQVLSLFSLRFLLFRVLVSFSIASYFSVHTPMRHDEISLQINNYPANPM
jgi:hypothetical protein